VDSGEGGGGGDQYLRLVCSSHFTNCDGWFGWGLEVTPTLWGHIY
jgi:hypothetical protein